GCAEMLPRSRRRAVRHLHAGDDRRGTSLLADRPARDQRERPRGHRRQPLPLHGVCEDRRGDPAGWSLAMIPVTSARSLSEAYALVSREVGAWAIQNRGTIGGNVCNASPAGDTLPLLLAAEATFVLGGPRGERRVKAEGFFVGYRKTALAADELLLRIDIPII